MKKKPVQTPDYIIPVGDISNPYDVPIKGFNYIPPKKEVDYLKLHTDLVLIGTHRTSTTPKEQERWK